MEIFRLRRELHRFFASIPRGVTLSGFAGGKLFEIIRIFSALASSVWVS